MDGGYNTTVEGNVVLKEIVQDGIHHAESKTTAHACMHTKTEWHNSRINYQIHQDQYLHYNRYDIYFGANLFYCIISSSTVGIDMIALVDETSISNKIEVSSLSWLSYDTSFL
jgi:hypothetical protein